MKEKSLVYGCFLFFVLMFVRYLRFFKKRNIKRIKISIRLRKNIGGRKRRRRNIGSINIKVSKRIKN